MSGWGRDLALALRQLEVAGNLGNVRLAVAGGNRHATGIP